ncbi:MAG: hypothetical protein BAA00_16530 [Parageobacillus thermoglucosidasius]|nr:MAG: hypothetical protein BAA00_16530 [Parageobacillus thermoglucosidasius]
MKDVLIMLIFGVFLYVFYKLMVKEPILPWKDKTSDESLPFRKRAKKNTIPTEQEPELFENLFDYVKDITHHMIRFNDNSFALICEVEPVNYFLKSPEEQEAIDVVFETWLASIEYPVGIYTQNRYIDISEPIENMQKAMKEAEDLNEAALSFGQNMIQDLIKWQTSTPRYETKRYLIFTHKVNIHEINADSKEELEEKLIEKTFAELFRRYNAAKSQLRKADIDVYLLPTEGIYELLYYTFNRKRAVKLRFKDLIKTERNALYVTADQTDERIERLKEAIEENDRQTEKEFQNQQAS